MFKNRISDVDKLQQEINAYRPLDDHARKQLKEYFRIGLTYSSNSLEGNSLTETETKIIIEDGITIGGKTLKDHFEVVGHSQAYDLMFSLVHEREITEKNILDLHRLFYYHIDAKNAGAYRSQVVFVTGFDVMFPKPNEISMCMNDLIGDMPQLQKQYHPVEYAARLHCRLVTIHPFIDGNGRTARLLMNLALLQLGYVVTIIPPVLRKDYLEAVRASNDKKYDLFVSLLSQMVYESQKDYLRMLEALNEK